MPASALLPVPARHSSRHSSLKPRRVLRSVVRRRCNTIEDALTCLSRWACATGFVYFFIFVTFLNPKSSLSPNWPARQGGLDQQLLHGAPPADQLKRKKIRQVGMLNDGIATMISGDSDSTATAGNKKKKHPLQSKHQELFIEEDVALRFDDDMQRAAVGHSNAEECAAVCQAVSACAMFASVGFFVSTTDLEFVQPSLKNYRKSYVLFSLD